MSVELLRQAADYIEAETISWHICLNPTIVGPLAAWLRQAASDVDRIAELWRHLPPHVRNMRLEEEFHIPIDVARAILPEPEEEY